MIKMKTKWIWIAGIATMISLFAGCNLGDGSSSSEVEAQVEAQLAEQEAATAASEAEQRAAQESASSSSSDSGSSSASSGSTGGGSGGFLWKPVSESNGRLVVLLPGSLRGRVSGCSISGSFGSETGSFAGDTHNGRRPHYRFSKPGRSYGSNITVTARTSSGNQSWRVPNGASRHTQ